MKDIYIPTNYASGTLAPPKYSLRKVSKIDLSLFGGKDTKNKANLSLHKFNGTYLPLD